jgi:transcriptional regulator with XRE-family HTH domain
MGKIRPKPLTLGAIVGRRVQEERKRQGLTQDELVERLARLGEPMDRSNLGRIENGKTKGQLDNVIPLALALGCSPIHLMLPREGEEVVELTPKRRLPARTARQWLTGKMLLPDSDPLAYAAAMSEDELHALAARLLAKGSPVAPSPITLALASETAAGRLRDAIEDVFAGRALERKRQKRRTKEENDG